jgi:acetylglutamate kinase
VPTDIGLVGEVIEVDTKVINEVLDAGQIPVISTAARDKSGQLFNVNADTATSALAVALMADEMVMLTDVPGVYQNWPDRDSLIDSISAAELETLLPQLQEGMVPKLEACLRASNGGVPTIRVTGDLTQPGTKVHA